MSTYTAAVSEAARRALLRVVRDAMRVIEERELEPAARWTLLRRVLDGLATPEGEKDDPDRRDE